MRNHGTDTTSNESPARTSLMVMAGGMLMLALAAGPALAGEDKPPEVTHVGLSLVPDTKVARVYTKPGADLSGYERVMILDAYVAFRKNWARDKTRSSVYTITKRDIERIKQETATLFRGVFVEELETKGGYAVVDNPEAAFAGLSPQNLNFDDIWARFAVPLAPSLVWREPKKTSTPRSTLEIGDHNQWTDARQVRK